MDMSRSQHRVSRRQFVHTIAAAGAGRSLLPAAAFTPSIEFGAQRIEEDGLTRGSPSEANVDSRVVLNFIDEVFANDLDLHSFMLYRHGKIVAEGWSWPYENHRPHVMHSLTKSVTACGVGLAIEEGHFGLEDKVISFFKDELPDVVSDELAALSVRDLLTMQAGHAETVSGSVFRPIRTSWVVEFFKIPVVKEPGVEFLYSSALSFMLSAIVTKTTGEAVRDYLEPRVFQPLGISGLTWGASPNGISSGGNGLTWMTADSLKLGILHLNKGRWDGQQVLPRSWVEEATRAQVPAGDYGYQWWLEESANAYYASGAFGQYSIVFPEHDAVLAITAGVPRGSPFHSVIFDHFPAAFSDADPASQGVATNELQNRIENLRLLPFARHTTSPLVPQVSGSTFIMESNDDSVSTIRLDFSDARVNFRLADHRGEHLVRVGLRDWIEGTTSITGNKLHHQYQADDMKVVAHGQWWDEHTFEMTWQFVETAWVDHVVCRFYDDRISVDRRTNANYASRIAPTLRGSTQGQ